MIQLAGKTYVVSLPSVWVKKYGIKKGDELNFEERGSELVIHTERWPKSERAVLDVGALNERTLRWVLSGFHKAGYNEMEILYSKKETLGVIQELLHNLFVGFTVVEQSGKKCIVRSIAADVDAEFDVILRRAFLVTLSMGEAVLEKISKGEFSSLEEVAVLERTNNQMTNFCERILNRKHSSSLDTFKYVIIWNLEKVADDYKYICIDLKNSKGNVSRELLCVFSEVNKLFSEYYKLFYQFDLERLNEIAERKMEIENSLKKLQISSAEESIVFNRLLSIVSKSADFSTSMFVLGYQSLQSAI